ncbi:hypothetical protein FPQ18DRAFT_391078 [Pyronema domesticum]|uniref:Uncharacterized protein n=1 Tax=Pyronema omphalodes (strain CBS 100304) TaxID=1076935 RepID=U4L2A7_PYROM|nr:hypothetical protein FPQ18DRAFT_391078 [Pyronema domesticum]CCX09806.1 Protein of unknown function [Pyronema omphalodes CBS 100304]
MPDTKISNNSSMGEKRKRCGEEEEHEEHGENEKLEEDEDENGDEEEEDEEEEDEEEEDEEEEDEDKNYEDDDEEDEDEEEETDENGEEDEEEGDEENSSAEKAYKELPDYATEEELHSALFMHEFNKARLMQESGICADDNDVEIDNRYSQLLSTRRSRTSAGMQNLPDETLEYPVCAELGKYWCCLMHKNVAVDALGTVDPCAAVYANNTKGPRYF